MVLNAKLKSTNKILASVSGESMQVLEDQVECNLYCIVYRSVGSVGEL